MGGFVAGGIVRIGSHVRERTLVLSLPRHGVSSTYGIVCDAIVTFDRRHFAGAERFGVRVMGPKEFLIDVGESK